MTLGVNPWDIYHNGAWYNRDGSGGPLPIGDYDSHAAEHAAMGVLVSGQWQWVPSIFRLLMTGTGTVTIDSRDALGSITIGVYSATLSGATNEIGFPYAGDAAVEIRATLTGSATAKVI